jgi:hypothetical protein
MGSLVEGLKRRPDMANNLVGPTTVKGKKKRCARCLKYKSFQHFGKDGRIKSHGLDSYCRKCRSEMASEFYNENTEKAKKWQQMVEAKRSRQYKWAAATKGSHKTRGVLVDIPVKELEQLAIESTHCGFCGVKLSWEIGKKKINLTSPTLENLNLKSSLKKEDFLIVCNQCNTTKGKRTFRQFLDYCTAVTERFKDK